MDNQITKKFYPQRRNLRLNSYDYSQHGAYFVTIYTKNKICLFGQVMEGQMILNPFGEAATTVWKELPLHYPEIDAEIFTVMPNHIHGIVVIHITGRAGSKPAPTIHPLSEGIRAFKTYSSRRINELLNNQGKSVWQRNYYEHIIRNENEFKEIGEYILYNPSKWETDKENPEAKR